MKFVILISVAMLLFAGTKAQDVSSLPIVAYPAKNFDPQKGIVVYLSGDGGENTFSKSFLQQLVAKGYSCVFFNSLKYFWSKKTAEQTGQDVEKVIHFYKNQWKAQKVILIGYSFGADVAPFVLNRLSKETYASVKNLVLVSASPTTDFEVHVTQLLGTGKTSGASVAAEINKIAQKPVLILDGEEESHNLNPAGLKVPYKQIKLKGGHRYDSNTDELANTIIQHL